MLIHITLIRLLPLWLTSSNGARRIPPTGTRSLMRGFSEFMKGPSFLMDLIFYVGLVACNLNLPQCHHVHWYFCRYTWKIYSERLMTLAGVYGFWKYVSKLERRENKRYLEMFYILKLRDLVSDSPCILFPMRTKRWQNAYSIMKTTYQNKLWQN